ncbi:MAG: hypothetical protein ACRYFX_27415 [Janthinobacterium lividum]
MTTLETIMQDLRQVSPQHLEEVRQLLQTIKEKEAANQKLAEQTMRILEGTDELPTEVWDDIMAYQQRLRAELFTRPTPFLDDEPHAA